MGDRELESGRRGEGRAVAFVRVEASERRETAHGGEGALFLLGDALRTRDLLGLEPNGNGLVADDAVGRAAGCLGESRGCHRVTIEEQKIAQLGKDSTVFRALQAMNVEIRALIGARLREERDRLHFSQDALASLGEVKRRTLQDWERGLAAPNGDFLAAICNHGVDVLYVLSGKRAMAQMQAIGGAWIAAEETTMLDQYRSAAPQHQAALREIVAGLARAAEQ